MIIWKKVTEYCSSCHGAGCEDCQGTGLIEDFIPVEMKGRKKNEKNEKNEG